MAEAVAVMDLSKYAQYFTASYTDPVYLMQPTTTPTEDGDISTAWATTGPVLGSVQAYSGDLAYKEYGLQTDCKKRIFLPPGTTVDVGWGVAFSADAAEPELYVKWAAARKTHTMLLAGTR